MENFLNKIKNKIIDFISFDEINPHNHWKYLINIFFIIIFILILFSFYFMYQIRNQQIYQVERINTRESILINEKLLKKVQESFSQKLLNQKQIIEDSKIYLDPSF